MTEPEDCPMCGHGLFNHRDGSCMACSCTPTAGTIKRWKELGWKVVVPPVTA